MKLLSLLHKTSGTSFIGAVFAGLVSGISSTGLIALVNYASSIYVFDEWASDQDPVFRELFYTQLLPALKNRGKTVIAISHDDHYFHVADRIIKLDYGQVEYDKRSH